MDVQPTEGEGLSLIGFRISPAAEGPELFTLIIYNGKDSPVLVDRQIAFVTTPAHVTSVYQLCNSRLRALGPPPAEADMICDIPETLELIRNKDRDDSAVILNCLNTIFDLVDAVEVSMPDEYKSQLYALADHLTFDREYGSFIKEQNADRELMINALMWCVGVVAVHARVLM
jgi:hypothetical protein